MKINYEEEIQGYVALSPQNEYILLHYCEAHGAEALKGDKLTPEHVFQLDGGSSDITAVLDELGEEYTLAEVEMTVKAELSTIKKEG